jgi:hypothetical protein
MVINNISLLFPHSHVNKKGVGACLPGIYFVMDVIYERYSFVSTINSHRSFSHVDKEFE